MRLRKCLLTILFICFAPIVANAKSNDFQNTLTKEEKQWLASAPDIRVSNEMNWAPFNFYSNDTPQGFSIDYMNLVAKKTGLKISYATKRTWNEYLKMIFTRELDVILNITRTDEREKFINFTEPYTSNPIAIASKKNVSYKNIQSLYGKTVAAPRGFWHEEILSTRHPQINLYLTDGLLDSIHAVETQRADVAIGAREVLHYLIKSNAKDLKVSSNVHLGTGNYEALSIGVRKGAPHLLSIIKKGMARITDEELSVLRNKWFSEKDIAKSADGAIDTGNLAVSTFGNLTAFSILSWPFIVTVCALAIISHLLIYHLITRRKRSVSGDLFSLKKIGVFLASILVLIIFSLSFFALEKINTSVRKSNVESLNVVMHSTEEVLSLWIGNNIKRQRYNAQNDELRALVVDLLTQPRTKEVLSKSETLSKIRGIHSKIRTNIDNDGFFVIAPDYINIGSRRNENLGVRNLIAEQRPDLLARAFNGETVFIPPIYSDLPIKQGVSTSHVSLFFAAPIEDENGKVIAVLTTRVNPSKDFSRICQFGRLGKTGETYLLDQEGRLLTRSRFESVLVSAGLIGDFGREILNFKVKNPEKILTEKTPKINYEMAEKWSFTKMAKSIVEKKSGRSIEAYNDYRGVPVLGVWHWNKQYGFGIATEIDYEEAIIPYLSAKELTYFVIALALTLSICSLAVSVFIGEKARKDLQKQNEDLEDRVSERTKELAHSQEMFRFSLEAMGVYYCVYDQVLQTATYDSDDFYNEFGFDLNERAIPLEKYVLNQHPDDRENSVDLLEAHMRGETPIYRAESRMMNRHDEWVWVLNIGKVIERDADGNATKVAGLTLDISSQKNVEDALEKAKEVAESATKAKSDFLANMSHEIRTPMNAIIGMTYLALQTELDKRQKDYIGKAEKAAKNLLGIINDILDFSKIEAGRMTLETIDFSLEESVSNLASVIAVKAQEKNLEFLVHVDPRVPEIVVGDSLRLGQVLLNLCGNAIKFTESGEVLVDVSMKELTDDDVDLVFSVKDTGIGMSEEQQAKLFQSFSQADASITRKYGGTGLGLAISKHIVDKMGGTISVKSAPNQGSTFSFNIRLPIRNKERVIHKKAAIDLQGLSILLIDDNESNVFILSEMIETMGFKILIAKNSKEAIDIIQEHAVDAVLIDSQLSTTSGIDVAKEIVDISPSLSPHIMIMASAFGSELVVKRAEEEGFAQVVFKPITPSTLFDNLAEMLSKDPLGMHDLINVSVGNSQKQKNLKGYRILLVEDNEINQQIAQEILSSAGAKVTLANDGVEGVDAALAEKFDIALMDIQMPNMDGYSATKKIRETLSPEALPIFAMTASAMQEDQDKAIEIGMQGHIAKPIDPVAVIKTIAEWGGDKHQDQDQDEGGEAESVARPDTQPSSTEILDSVSDIAALDVGEGLNRVGKNEKLYINLLQKFAIGQSGVKEKVSEALAQDDVEGATRMVHTLKGVAGNIGAKEIYLMAQKWEQALKDGELDFSSDLPEKLEALCAQIIDLLPEEKQEGDMANSALTEVEKEKISPSLSKLKSLLEEDDTQAVDVMDELEEMVPALSGALAPVRKSMSAYDYPDALKQFVVWLDKQGLGVKE